MYGQMRMRTKEGLTHAAFRSGNPSDKEIAYINRAHTHTQTLNNSNNNNKNVRTILHTQTH